MFYKQLRFLFFLVSISCLYFHFGFRKPHRHFSILKEITLKKVNLHDIVSGLLKLRNVSDLGLKREVLIKGGVS